MKLDPLCVSVLWLTVVAGVNCQAEGKGPAALMFSCNYLLINYLINQNKLLATRLVKYPLEEDVTCWMVQTETMTPDRFVFYL